MATGQGVLNHPKKGWAFQRWSGFALLAVGALLIAGAGSYLGYSLKAKSDLKHQVFKPTDAQVQTLFPKEFRDAQTGGSQPQGQPPANDTQPAAGQSGGQQPIVAPPIAGQQSGVTSPSPTPLATRSQPTPFSLPADFSISHTASARDGFMDASFWESTVNEDLTALAQAQSSTPATGPAYEPPNPEEQVVAAGKNAQWMARELAKGKTFRYANWATAATTVQGTPPALRIVIPALGIDSGMVELTTVWEGDKYVWQRPVDAVGHHEGTPNPGERGNMVLSGHRSSPVRHEGEVFKRLGEIGTLLKNAVQNGGEPVDIFVYTKDMVFVYRVVSTDVIDPSDVFQVFEPTDDPTLTLITCTPDYVYYNRLLVRAKLLATIQ